MRRAVGALAMLLCTLAYAVFSFAGGGESATPVKIVRVRRGDVHQVTALSGIVRYAEEEYVLAPVSGFVAQICTAQGGRAAEGDAIVRIESAAGEDVLSAWAAGAEWLENAPQVDAAWAVRAERSCNVRQVLVEEGSPVAAGTPLARVTSHLQEILCVAAKADLAHIQPGMWAELMQDGEQLCSAHILSVGVLAADPLTGMASAEVTLIPEQHIDCVEGSKVDVDVRLAGSDDVMVLPIEAITPRNTVWWVNDEGRCTEIPAGIVMMDELFAWVELPEGLPVALGEMQEGQLVREAAE